MYRDYHLNTESSGVSIVVLGAFGTVSLSEWQCELLYRVCQGESFKEISRYSGRSHRAIAACVDRIRKKFCCKTRIELIAKCYEHHVVKPVGRERILPKEV